MFILRECLKQDTDATRTSRASQCMCLKACSLEYFLVGGSRVTLVVIFAFLPQNFGKVMGTYELYFVGL